MGVSTDATADAGGAARRRHRRCIAGLALALLAACAPAAWHTGAGLPDDIERALQTDERVLDCPTGTRGGISAFDDGWVAVRRVDLNDDAQPDWLLRGVHPCLRRGGLADWWLYAQAPEGRRLLGTWRAARAVDVLRSQSHGWRDLRVSDGSGTRVVRYRDGGY